MRYLSGHNGFQMSLEEAVAWEQLAGLASNGTSSSSASGEEEVTPSGTARPTTPGVRPPPRPLTSAEIAAQQPTKPVAPDVVHGGVSYPPGAVPSGTKPSAAQTAASKAAADASAQRSKELVCEGARKAYCRAWAAQQAAQNEVWRLQETGGSPAQIAAAQARLGSTSQAKLSVDSSLTKVCGIAGRSPDVTREDCIKFGITVPAMRSAPTTPSAAPKPTPAPAAPPMTITVHEPVGVPVPPPAPVPLPMTITVHEPVGEPVPSQALPTTPSAKPQVALEVATTAMPEKDYPSEELSSRTMPPAYKQPPRSLDVAGQKPKMPAWPQPRLPKEYYQHVPSVPEVLPPREVPYAETWVGRLGSNLWDSLKKSLRETLVEKPAAGYTKMWEAVQGPKPPEKPPVAREILQPMQPPVMEPFISYGDTQAIGPEYIDTSKPETVTAKGPAWPEGTSEIEKMLVETPWRMYVRRHGPISYADWQAFREAESSGLSIEEVRRQQAQKVEEEKIRAEEVLRYQAKKAEEEKAKAIIRSRIADKAALMRSGVFYDPKELGAAARQFVEADPDLREYCEKHPTILKDTQDALGLLAKYGVGATLEDFGSVLQSSILYGGKLEREAPWSMAIGKIIGKAPADASEQMGMGIGLADVFSRKIFGQPLSESEREQLKSELMSGRNKLDVAVALVNKKLASGGAGYAMMTAAKAGVQIFKQRLPKEKEFKPVQLTSSVKTSAPEVKADIAKALSTNPTLQDFATRNPKAVELALDAVATLAETTDGAAPSDFGYIVNAALQQESSPGYIYSAARLVGVPEDKMAQYAAFHAAADIIADRALGVKLTPAAHARLTRAGLEALLTGEVGAQTIRPLVESLLEAKGLKVRELTDAEKATVPVDFDPNDPSPAPGQKAALEAYGKSSRIAEELYKMGSNADSVVKALKQKFKVKSKGVGDKSFDNFIADYGDEIIPKILEANSGVRETWSARDRVEVYSKLAPELNDKIAETITKVLQYKMAEANAKRMLRSDNPAEKQQGVMLIDKVTRQQMAEDAARAARKAQKRAAEAASHGKSEPSMFGLGFFGQVSGQPQQRVQQVRRVRHLG